MDRTKTKQIQLEKLLQKLWDLSNEMNSTITEIQRLTKEANEEAKNIASQMQATQSSWPDIQPVVTIAPSVEHPENDGFLWGIFGMGKKLFGSATNIVGKTIQTGMNVAWSAAQTVVNTWTNIAQGVWWAVAENQNGTFLENTIWMAKGIVSNTVNSWVQAVSDVVTIGKDTAGSAIDITKETAWGIVSTVPGELWGDLLRSATDTIGNVAWKALDTTANLTDNTLNLWKETFQTVSNTGSSLISWDVSWVIDNLWGMVGNISSTVTNAAGTVSNGVSAGIETIASSVGTNDDNQVQEWTIQWPTL